MTVILMSRSEIDRMNVLRDLAEERFRVSEAATLMGLGRRHVLRLARAFRAKRGAAALASRRRGKPSNRSYPGVLRTEVTGIIRERYADFGPTLAGEKLAELHGIRLARETIRQWMMVAGLWQDRRQRMRPVHESIDGVSSPIYFAPGDRARCEIYSISRDAFVFYNDLQSLLNNDGGLFSQPPSNSRSNVTNGALGFFQASALHVSEIEINP